MKTSIKTFRFILLVFICFYSLAVVYFAFASFSGQYFIPEKLYRTSFFGDLIKPNFYAYYTLNLLTDIFLIYSLLQLLKITDFFKEQNYFTPKIIRLLKSSGRNFIATALIGVLGTILYNYMFTEHPLERMFMPFIHHFMILILGLGILVIEEIQKRALHIKSENDLTI